MSGLAQAGWLHPQLLDRPQWLSGGAFGPEASVFAVVVDLAAVLLLCWWKGMARTPSAWRLERQRSDFTGPEAANPRSQAAFSDALLIARHRAAPSFTRPSMLPGGADAGMAARGMTFLFLSGMEICGTTRSSGRWLPGSLAFSDAMTAALRVGTCLEAAVMGAGAEAGADAGGGVAG